MIETNLDDISVEYLGRDFQQRLLEAGAIDFFLTSVQMKKGRPGVKLSVLSEKKHLESAIKYILEHTTTIGVRYYPVKRSILNRKITEVETSLGKVRVKIVEKPSGTFSYKIEYESLVELGRNHEFSLTQLQTLLNKELLNKTWSI